MDLFKEDIMKIICAVTAMNAVCELMEEKTSFAFAHALCVAKDRLSPHVQFYTESEMEIISRHAIQNEDGTALDANGTFRVDPSHISDFRKEKAELDDVEIDFEKVRAKHPPEEISGKQLEALMQVMDFEEGSE